MKKSQNSMDKAKTNKRILKIAEKHEQTPEKIANKLCVKKFITVTRGMQNKIRNYFLTPARID